MKIIETLIKILVLCMPIGLCMIADVLSNIITMEMTMRVAYIALPITILYLVKCDIEERRKKRWTEQKNYCKK